MIRYASSTDINGKSTALTFTVAVLVAALSLCLLWGSARGFARASPPSSPSSSKPASHDGEAPSFCSNQEDEHPATRVLVQSVSSDQTSKNVVAVDFHPDDRRLLLYHFESSTSTQDEAKLIAEAFGSRNDSEVETFCVTTTTQTSGRGTSGRQWFGTPGNVFVTIGIQQSTWSKQLPGVPLTLLPLKVGEMTARTVQRLLDDCRELKTTQLNRKDRLSLDEATVNPIVTVKWPNDVLCDNKKISGTLIESANGWFLIGIGINLEYAPEVPTSGPNHGRPSVSVRDVCPTESEAERELNTQKSDRARQVGVQLAHDLHTWLHEGASSAQLPTSTDIVDSWKVWLDWDIQLMMRDTPGREVVRLIDVLEDGRVKVQKEDGSTQVLVSDYFL